MLLNHEHVLNDNMYIHLDEIKESGLNIIIYFFTNQIEYKNYLEIKENINFNILKILNNEKVPLSYKAQTIQLKK
jgi:MscS family membrane protein